MLKRRVGKAGEAPREGASEGFEQIRQTLREKSPNGHRIEPFDDAALMENIHLVNAHYDRSLAGEPGSERRLLGPLFVLVKRVVRRLTSWHINPALDNQRLFNAYVTRSLNEMKRYLDHLQINEDILSTIMHRDLTLFRANILYLNKQLERRMLDFEEELKALRSSPLGIGLPAGEGCSGDGGPGGESLLSSLDVLTLEQRVHGSPRVARERHKAYLKYLRGCDNVLALGCGRGELLHLLAGENIKATGTETNAVLVDYCRDHGLEVVRADPVEYLERLADASVDGISLARFAGHQPPARLVRMLDLCRRKITDGGVLIIETPNPFSLYAVACYALDESDGGHPLHPETLKLLCLSYDFIDPEVIFLEPLPPEERLEEIEPKAVGAELGPREQELFHEVNLNFAKINRILFSHRDYSVVARRAGRGAS